MTDSLLREEFRVDGLGEGFKAVDQTRTGAADEVIIEGQHAAFDHCTDTVPIRDARRPFPG